MPVNAVSGFADGSIAYNFLGLTFDTSVGN